MFWGWNIINESGINSLSRLESTISAFVEQYTVLSVERDKAVNNFARVSGELQHAREQIEQVQAVDEGIEISLSDSNDNEGTKQEIISRIDSLIARIDTLHIDDESNG